MSSISGVYGDGARDGQVLVVQGGCVYAEPDPGDRFAVVMEHPFARQHRDTVQIILDVGSFVIKMDAAAEAVRKLRASLLADMPGLEALEQGGLEALEQGGLDAYQNSYVAGLPDASGEFTGTFGLTDEEINELAMPPATMRDDTMNQAAKQVMDDARLGLLVHPGNTLHISTGSISVTIS